MSLDTIDSFKSDNVISQKVANLLSTSYGDPSLRAALNAVEPRLIENNVENRMNLRPTIEAEIVKSSGQTLKEFSKMATKLQGLGQAVDQLNQMYDKMEEIVSRTSKGNLQLVTEARKLQKEEEVIDTKLTLLQAFEDKFVVSPQEVDILSTTGLPVDGLFFDTLEKVKRIYQDCSALLSDDAVAGQELMSKITGYLDRGYEKLAFYAQQSFRATLHGQTNMRVDKQLRRTLIFLTERPSLFENALAGLCEVRQKFLSLEFIRALTEDTSVTNKPIDFYAYDVTRYIGDMMAWIHSAVVGEKENLEALFEKDREASERLQEGQESEPWNKVVDISEIIEGQVDKITSTLVKPLRMRMEHAISAQTRPTTIYQVLNTLKFYNATFAKSFKYHRHDAAILTVINQLESAVLRQFNRCLESKITNIRQTKLDHEAVKMDLQPPEFLFDAMGDARAVLTSFETSISYVPGAEINASSRQVIENLVEPYLECCNRIASDLPNGSAEVFMINCYDTAMVTLLLFSFTSFKTDQLEKRIDELRDALIDQQVHQFQRESGISNTDIDDKDAIRKLSSRLYDFLPTCTVESSSQLQNLSSPTLARKITLNTCEQFIQLFEQLKIKLDEKYGSQEADLLLPRTTQEVRLLLQVE